MEQGSTRTFVNLAWLLRRTGMLTRLLPLPDGGWKMYETESGNRRGWGVPPDGWVKSTIRRRLPQPFPDRVMTRSSVIYGAAGLPVRPRDYDKRTSAPRPGVHLAEGQIYNGPHIIFQGGEEDQMALDRLIALSQFL